MLLNSLGTVIEPPVPPTYRSVDIGLPKFISNVITLIAIAGGIFSLINIVLAGLDFITASGDPKKIQNALAKIWQSFVGLLIIASAFVIAGLIGYIFFGSPSFILKPFIRGPGTL